MGILESDLVKVGVEILTKFLEIVNKATGTLGSFGNALTKVFSVFAFFKLGQKLFDKFKTPLLRFFVDVADESYKGGVNAMKAYKKGVEDEKNNTAKITESKKPERPTPDPAIKNMGIGERFTYANQKRKENKDLRNIINEKK
jgi:hypothetical protein